MTPPTGDLRPAPHAPGQPPRPSGAPAAGHGAARPVRRAGAPAAGCGARALWRDVGGRAVGGAPVAGVTVDRAAGVRRASGAWEKPSGVPRGAVAPPCPPEAAVHRDGAPAHGLAPRRSAIADGPRTCPTGADRSTAGERRGDGDAQVIPRGPAHRDRGARPAR
ncbi:hypothetical protein Saso_63270 [Streptomyces asoensis]|uniref:Uncharacterized protein n=1 Tax=Streptomyces asoensis TaxID=249586 RepID=A0ABQ3S975_9ACTN|nr:hypothetical protein Saso_63270 [Streptomyces asoensis]